MIKCLIEPPTLLIHDVNLAYTYLYGKFCDGLLGMRMGGWVILSGLPKSYNYFACAWLSNRVKLTSVKSISNRYRYSLILLKQLVKTDFKLRYQGSALGYLWSLLKPLFLFGILYVVFVVIVKVDYGVHNSGAYLLLGIVLWSFFAELTGGSVTSIVAKGDLIRKINFPKHVIVMATAFSAFINMVLNFLVVLVFLLIGGVSFGWNVLLVPILVAELFVVSLAAGLILSTAYVRFRDVGYIWDVATQALFYLTPILFPITFAPLWVQKILMLNPLAQIIQDLRFILVSRQTTTIVDVFSGYYYMRIVPIVITLVALAIGARYFKLKSKSFAENI